MPADSDLSLTSPPSDVCLLLRAHAEQRWLSTEVLPVLRELERGDSLPEEQLGAALAYLEVIWIEASRRAAETDATLAELEATCPVEAAGSIEATDYTPGLASARRDRPEVAEPPCAAADRYGATALPAKARRYQASVRSLREVMGAHVSRLIATPTDAFTYDHAG